MKKLRLFLVILLFVCAGLFAQNVSLREALQSSVQTIDSQLPQGSTVAVLSFTVSPQNFSDDVNEISAQNFSAFVIDEIAAAISERKKIKVVERQYLDVIRQELNIQMSGDVSDDEIRRVGRQLGAQYVVTGSFVDVGNAYRFRLAAINVETAIREASPSLYIHSNDPQVAFLLHGRVPPEPPRHNAQFWSVGASVGTSFTMPWVIGTIRGTLAPFRYSFLELGVDAGFISGKPDLTYYSVYPFAHYAFFLPFERGGWYIGGGIGFMIGTEIHPYYTVSPRIIAADAVTGINIGDVFDVSYTLHTDFKNVSNKFSVGYTYRFK